MKSLLIATSKEAVPQLAAGGRSLGCENVLIVFNKEHAVCADKAYIIEGAESGICALPAVTEIVERECPDLILAEQNTDGRLFAAAAAAKLKTAVLTDCTELYRESGYIYARRMSYGGSAYTLQRTAGKAVACISSGLFEAMEESPCTDVRSISICPDRRIKFISRQEKEVQNVNLSAARVVIGVGRGIGSEENLRLAEKLAGLIGAELACTRPISEEEGWMPRQRYIGVSGKMIKPDLYIALGISGQVQHTVGISSAGTIVAINKDKTAPMFRQCDCGLVADLNDVLPRLTAVLED